MTAEQPAEGYVPSTTDVSGTRLRWMHSNCIFVRPSSTGSADINDGSDLEALRRATSNWETATASCSYMTFNILEPIDDVELGFDKDGPNENVVVWVESEWAHEPQAAAITTVFFIDNKGSDQDGRIIDGDIELNGAFFTFSTTGDKSATDVENTLTHELGHLLGLDHPCDDGMRSPLPKDNLGQPIPSCTPISKLPLSLRESTMYNFAQPGEIKKRTPEAGDVQGICDTYPIDKNPGQCVQVNLESGGCVVAATPDDGSPTALVLLGLAVVLCAAWSLRRRAD